jgi:hypothetical protein
LRGRAGLALAARAILWKTPISCISIGFSLASFRGQAYTPPSRRPQPVVRGPLLGPRVTDFGQNLGLQRGAENWRKRLLTEARSAAYTPRLTQTGLAKPARTYAADSRPDGHCPRMFDIVNGRETRAAVLLAASPDRLRPVLSAQTTRRFAFFYGKPVLCIPISFG